MARSDDSLYRTKSEQAEYLRELREDRGWTLAEAEHHAEVYLVPGAVEQAEQEGVDDGYTMAALAEIYGVATLSILHRPDPTLEQRIGLIERKLELYEETIRPMYETPWEGEGHDPWDKDDPEERAAGLARCNAQIETLRRRLVELQLRLAAETLHGPQNASELEQAMSTELPSAPLELGS